MGFRENNGKRVPAQDAHPGTPGLPPQFTRPHTEGDTCSPFLLADRGESAVLATVTGSQRVPMLELRVGTLTLG